MTTTAQEALDRAKLSVEQLRALRICEVCLENYDRCGCHMNLLRRRTHNTGSEPK